MNKKVKFISVFLILVLVFGSINFVFAEGSRLGGANRYETSFAIADELYDASDKFENVIVTYGGNYPDALSGGYLAKIKDAPILLVDKNKEGEVLDYIKEHLTSEGNVYLLGATGVVSKSFEDSVAAEGFNVVRLAGQNRYDTNLAILSEIKQVESEASGESTDESTNEVSIEIKGLLIARGDAFPDALSGSSVGLPILLVGSNLTKEQSYWIKNSGMTDFYILGGTGAVPQSIEDNLKSIGSVKRIGGANRYDTSKLVADEFFKDAKTVVLATGAAFPDALSGAPLALSKDAPILLAANNDWSKAQEYVAEHKIKDNYVLGGTLALSDDTVAKIMGDAEQEEQEESEGAEMVNNFAVALLKETTKTTEPEGDIPVQEIKPGVPFKENTLVSPISVLYAMGMTANGADGETLDELIATLTGEEGDSAKIQETLNEYLAGYLDSISKYSGSDAEGESTESTDDDQLNATVDDEYDKDPTQLEIANSLWIKEDPKLTVKDSFIKANVDRYKAGIFRAVFDDATRVRVNEWIEEHTGGTIKDMLSSLPEESIMLLVNALAFEAEWAEGFESTQVRAGEFHGEAGDKEVAFMLGQENLYLKDDNASGFIKYYNGGDFAFAALLPEEGTSVDEYIADLDGSKLHEILANPIDHSVNIKLPKFETESSMSLSDAFVSMGAGRAFDTSLADFSKLGEYEDQNIFIGDILHKTYIKVNERGTKAGAATVVHLATTSAADPEEPYEVTLDRPFIYMLIDTNESIPLFVGVMRNI